MENKKMEIDRVEASRALAKAIAYKNCGKLVEAENWTIDLLKIIGQSDLLK